MSEGGKPDETDPPGFMLRSHAENSEPLGSETSSSGADLLEDMEDLECSPMSSGTTLPVLEQVLLAIIRAHPPGEKDKLSEQQRLKAAMRALVRRDPFSSPWIDADRKLLKIMELEYAKDHPYTLSELTNTKRADSSKMKRDARSIHELAALAVERERKKSRKEFTNGDTATRDRIYEKFTGVYYRKNSPKTNIHAEDFGNERMLRARRYNPIQHDYIAESIETSCIERIIEALKLADIPTKLKG